MSKPIINSPNYSIFKVIIRQLDPYSITSSVPEEVCPKTILYKMRGHWPVEVPLLCRRQLICPVIDIVRDHLNNQ